MLYLVACVPALVSLPSSREIKIIKLNKSEKRPVTKGWFWVWLCLSVILHASDGKHWHVLVSSNRAARQQPSSLLTLLLGRSSSKQTAP